MFAFLLFILLSVILLLIGKYYSFIILRFLNLWKVKVTKSKKIGIYFISYTLAFLSFDIFQSIGILLLHFLVFSLIFDGMYFLIRKIYKSDKGKVRKILYESSVIPFVVTLIFFAYGYINMRHIVETNYTVYTEKNISEPLKILFLTDSHYGKVLKKKSLDKLIQKIKNQKLDMVILGGDIIDENTEKKEMEEIFKVLGSIPSKSGTFYVYGNHDKQKYSQEKKYTEQELEHTLKENHITVLQDKVTKINDFVVLIGRDDVSQTRKEITEYEWPKKSYAILIDHQPKDYDTSSSLGIDLILSGHTHAGQVFPAGYFIKWFHMAKLYYGHQKINNMDAIVSSGLAGWGFPIRTQKHSEYVIINVEKMLDK